MSPESLRHLPTWMLFVCLDSPWYVTKPPHPQRRATSGHSVRHPLSASRQHCVLSCLSSAESPTARESHSGTAEKETRDGWGLSGPVEVPQHKGLPQIPQTLSFLTCYGLASSCLFFEYNGTGLVWSYTWYWSEHACPCWAPHYFPVQLPGYNRALPS